MAWVLVHERPSTVTYAAPFKERGPLEPIALPRFAARITIGAVAVPFAAIVSNVYFPSARMMQSPAFAAPIALFSSALVDTSTVRMHAGGAASGTESGG